MDIIITGSTSIVSASRIIVVFIVLILLCGCDQRPLGTEVEIKYAQYEVLHSFSYTRKLTGVWAGDDGSVFAGYTQVEEESGGFDLHVYIFPEGAVFRLEGSEWVDLDFPFREYSADLDIWGSGSENVYVADGNLHRFDGQQWIQEAVSARVIAGVSENEIYVADYQAVYMFDGDSWDHFHTFEDSGGPDVIWACEGPSILVAKYPGITHYHEGVWTEYDLPFAAYDFVGSGPDDIYAFGVKSYYDRISAVWHFDGTEWSEVFTIEDILVECAWGSSMNDIYAAGEYGVIVHYDGTEWTRMNSLTFKSIHDMSGSSSDDIYMVGDNQKVLHLDDTGGSSIWIDQPEDCREIWAESSSRMAVSEYAGSIYLLDEGSWRETVIYPPLYIYDLWGTDLENLFAACSGGSIYRYDGIDWILETESFSEGSVISLHGTSLTDIHAVGDSLIFHYDGTEWTDMTIPGVPRLRAVWAIDEQNAFAAGDNGVVMRFDGSSWTFMNSGTTETIYSVWGATPDDVHAVGETAMLRFDGVSWYSQPAFRAASLTGLAGWASDNIIAYGYRAGFLLRFDGRNWNPEFIQFSTQDCMIAPGGDLFQTGTDDGYGMSIIRSIE